MNGYQRLGFPTTADILQVVSDHRPFAAQFLAAEERHSVDAMLSEQMRRLREARAMSGGRLTASTRLRQSVGSALVRFGERLQGAPSAGASTAITATGTAG